MIRQWNLLSPTLEKWCLSSKADTNLTRKLGMARDMSESSLRGGDPAILPRRISFHGGVSRDVLFPEKVVLCYRCKTRHMLGENCPVATPTPEGSDMSCSEQNETSQDPPSAGSQQKSSDSEERGDGSSSAEESGGDSTSESTSTSRDDVGSERVASVPETPLQRPVASTPQKNPVKQTSRPDSGPTNKKTVRRLRTLRSVDQNFTRYRNKIWLFKEVLSHLKSEDVDYEAKLLSWAGELVYHRLREKTYFETLNTYTRRYTLDKELNPGPASAVFDDILFH